MKINRTDTGEFGKRLRALRIERGYSMDTFCEKYNEAKNQNLSKSTVSRWEKNVQEPMVSSVASIADFFGVSSLWLLGESKVFDNPKEKALIMEDKATCAERIREALTMRDMTQADLCRVTGIPTSAMSQYCNGSLVPRQKRTQIIASALDVDVAWLMGFDMPSKQDLNNLLEMMKSKEAKALTDEEAELLSIFRSLDIRSRVKLLSYAFGLEADEKGE